MKTILVFNATGMQGRAISKLLIESGNEIVAPVRNEAKALELNALGIKSFVTDFSASTLSSEIKKVDQVVLQIPAAIEPDNMVRISKVAIDAILEAGYPKTVFVISSTLPDERVGKRSVDARVEMKDYALKHLPKTPILSSTEYLENFSTAYRSAIENDGVIPQTIPPQFPVNYLSWNDLAVYVEAALSKNIDGKLYRIGGREGITGGDLAKRLGTVIGKELQYVPISHEELAQFLKPIMGEQIAKDYAEFYEFQDTVGKALLNPDTEGVRKLFGVTLSPLEIWAKEAFH